MDLYGELAVGVHQGVPLIYAIPGPIFNQVGGETFLGVTSGK